MLSISEDISTQQGRILITNLSADWLIDFNGMSTRRVLFYAGRLENAVYLHL